MDACRLVLLLLGPWPDNGTSSLYDAHVLCSREPPEATITVSKMMCAPLVKMSHTRQAHANPTHVIDSCELHGEFLPRASTDDLASATEGSLYTVQICFRLALLLVFFKFTSILLVFGD